MIFGRFEFEVYIIFFCCVWDIWVVVVLFRSLGVFLFYVVSDSNLILISLNKAKLYVVGVLGFFSSGV